MKPYKGVLLICAILTICAYGGALMAMGNKPADNEVAPSVRVDKLYADLHCGLPQAQLVWIDSLNEYQILFSKLRLSHRDAQGVKPPPVDWSRYAVLLAGMGQKNTGGYRLDLDNTAAAVNDSVISISLRWQEPKPGMIVTQVLTSPCLLLKIPKGEYGRIQIKDQAGTVRLQLQR